MNRYLDICNYWFRRTLIGKWYAVYVDWERSVFQPAIIRELEIWMRFATSWKTTLFSTKPSPDSRERNQRLLWEERRRSSILLDHLVLRNESISDTLLRRQNMITYDKLIITSTVNSFHIHSSTNNSLKAIDHPKVLSVIWMNKKRPR